MEEERDGNQTKFRHYHHYKQETRCITTQSHDGEGLIHQKESLLVDDNQSYNTTIHPRTSHKGKEKYHKVKSSAQ